MTGPQANMTVARAAWAVWKPWARRIMSRTLLFSPSWRPLDRPRLMAVVMPSRCFRIVRAVVTNLGIRLRWAFEHHRSSRVLVVSVPKFPVEHRA